MVGRRFRTRIRVTLANGGAAIVAFGLQSHAGIELVLRAWELLYQRELRGWEQTSLPAEYWYDGRKRRMCRYDDPICHDLLEMLIPLAVAIQHRQKAVEEMQRQGRRASQIAEYLKMPLPTVEKMLNDSAKKSPPTGDDKGPIWD